MNLSDLSVPVVILAGGQTDSIFRRHTHYCFKADLPTPDGSTMLARTVRAVEQLQPKEVVIVGRPAENPLHSWTERGENLGDSLFKGLRKLENPSAAVLVLSADLPDLQSEDLKVWLGYALNLSQGGAELVLSLTDMQAYREVYPATRRTSLRIASRRYTLGNCALVSSAALLRQENVIHRATALRKKPLALASMLGPGFLANVLLNQIGINRVSLSGVTGQVGDVLGLHGAGLTCHPSLAHDIDTYAQYQSVINGGPTPVKTYA